MGGQHGGETYLQLDEALIAPASMKYTARMPSSANALA
jgi:hypothetical protein